MISLVKYESSKKEGRSKVVVDYNFKRAPAERKDMNKRMTTWPWEDRTKCLYDYLVSKKLYGGDEGIFEDIEKDRKVTVKKKLGLKMRITAEAWKTRVPIEELLKIEEVDTFIITGNLPS